MEEFLDVIVKIEREATQLQEEAQKKRAAIEQRYRVGLHELEEKALAALAEELRALAAEAEEEAKVEGETILREGRRRVEILREKAARRREEAVALVRRLLLEERGARGS